MWSMVSSAARMCARSYCTVVMSTALTYDKSTFFTAWHGNVASSVIFCRIVLDDRDTVNGHRTHTHALVNFFLSPVLHLKVHVFRRCVVANVRENCQSNRLTDRSPLKR